MCDFILLILFSCRFLHASMSTKSPSLSFSIQPHIRFTFNRMEMSCVSVIVSPFFIVLFLFRNFEHSISVHFCVISTWFLFAHLFMLWCSSILFVLLNAIWERTHITIYVLFSLLHSSFFSYMFLFMLFFFLFFIAILNFLFWIFHVWKCVLSYLN